MVKSVRKTLEGILSKENIKVDRVDLLCYSNDMTPYKYEPDILVLVPKAERLARDIGHGVIVNEVLPTGAEVLVTVAQHAS